MFKRITYATTLFYSLCFVVDILAKLEPLLTDLDYMRDSISSCVLIISKLYFNEQEVISISLTASSVRTNTFPIVLDQKLLGFLFNSSKASLYTKKYSRPSYVFNVIERIHNYIIQIRNVKDITRTITHLKQSFWNPHAKFVVITTTIFQDPLAVVTQISELLWKFRIMDAIILLPRKDNISILDIYTWFPFNNGMCGKYFGKVVIINTCQNGNFFKAVNLFPKKVPKNLNECLVRVRTVMWPPYVIPPKNLNRTSKHINFTEGIEIRLMNTVAEALNLTVKYSASTEIQDWGDILSNGSATGGLFKALVEEKVDIGLGATAATTYRYLYLHPTTAYTAESITWCVPKANVLPKWVSLLKILELRTWLATLLAFIFIVTMIWLIGLLKVDESSTFTHLGSCYLYMFATSLGLSLKLVPRQPGVRVVFVMWTIYCLHLSVVFKTSLVSKLTNPDYMQQITTMEEVFKAKLQFGFLPAANIYFQEETADPVIRKIQNDIEFCHNAEQCLDRVAFNRDFAMGIPRLYLLYMSTRYINKKTGYSLLYCFKDNMVSYPVHLYSYNGYPLIGRIKEQVDRIISAGFLNKWLSNAMRIYKTKRQSGNGNEDNDDDDDDNIEALTFPNLQGAFYVLFFGYGFSLVAFVGERLYFKYCSRIFKIRKRYFKF